MADQQIRSNLPEIFPGHWSSVDGRDMAVQALHDPNMARSREMASDFHLANKVFLSPNIANLTDAKERIRWLSAQLAREKIAADLRVRDTVPAAAIEAQMAAAEAEAATTHWSGAPLLNGLTAYVRAMLASSAAPSTIEAAPVEPSALDAAIAELEAFERDGTILDEIDDWAGFSECVMLCLHELKRLRAQADVRAQLDQYQKAWEALFGPLSWMQYSDQLTAYAGWGLSEIANDLIDRAYPGLRSSAVAVMEGQTHG